jgi:predicted ATPase
MNCSFSSLLISGLLLYSAHPEPLSVITHSLDAYLRSLAMCPMHRMDHSSEISSSRTSMKCSCSGRSENVRARLRSMIFPQGLGMLARHIPSLKLLLGVVPPSNSPGLNESMMASLFSKLLHAISSKQAPILFFLDDLQWADPLSLSLLVETVKEASPDLNLSVTDIKLSDSRMNILDEEAHIMFVGSYRDNEIDNAHPLMKVLHKFRGDSSINMTDISLSGLSHESLNEMLSDTLSLPTRRVKPLSELVIQKTGGHPLHVIEFIQALSVNNLLTHSFSKGWEWDADSIDIFPITDSVAELYSFKLQRLPKDVLLGVQILSCFGFQVNQQVLDFVADYDGQDSVDMNAVLQVATSEGLVERAGPLISFTHDMILKAAIDSIPDHDFVSLLRKLLTTLIKEASVRGSLDSVLFVAVDLINRIGSAFTTVSKERAMFAELNLRAATSAIAVPDFAGAARYAENGISFLGDTCWETQYDLCIRLYEASVLSLFPSSTGDRSKLKNRIQLIFGHARDFSDKFKTHLVWVQILSGTDISKGIKECINALVQLGEPLDLARVDHNRVCSELVKQMEQYSELTIEGILFTERRAEMNKMRAMKVMSLLLRLYHQSNNITAAFVSCKMVELSMRHGTCEDSIHGVAAFASALVNILGHIENGSAWGRKALLLLKSFGDKPTLIPTVHASVYGSIFMFTGKHTILTFLI